MKAFPLRFDFSDGSWQGARARLHTAREDAFQQLVGDALRGVQPSFVETFSTEGRDGSIDAFVAAKAPLPGLFAGLPTPIIVECKDNDDRSDAVLENVISSWRKLADKLERKAKEKWPDLYQPWLSARGYVYATSATLPHKKAREDLHARIKSFFDRLRNSELCSIEEVRVVDWSDLRHFFDMCPGLADRWLGVETTTLLAHDDRTNQLTGFARYLRDLPFIEPPVDHPAHPRNIFREAAGSAGQYGLLLVGAGGVGKTRTLLEVANLAAAAGWRVLHTAGWGRGLTQDELAREVLDQQADTLLVVDYITQLKDVDFRWMQARLLPEARKRGIKLCVVASERPVHFIQANEESRRYFRTIQLEPDPAQTDQIVGVMIDHAAAHAAQVFGRDRVRALAGRRPIIALFIMQELERRAVGYSGRGWPYGASRSSELLDWLSARLNEDTLTPRPIPSLWSRSSAGPELLASAAVLCAAPQPQPELIDVAAHVISSVTPSGRIESEIDPSRVVDVLLDLGWLEPRDKMLAVAHDVVAEEVLLRALRDGSERTFSERALRQLLAPSKRSSRTLARTTSVMDRVADAVPSVAQFLAASIPSWVSEHAMDIGSSLASADGDVADIALHGLFATQPWADAVSTHYDEIVRPFIEQHGMRLNAALPFVHALGHARPSSKNVAHLCSAAVSWCSMYIDSDISHLVARIMLMRSDIPIDVARGATELACTIVARGPSEGRIPLVGALLARPELTRSRGQDLIRLVHQDLKNYALRRHGHCASSSDYVAHLEMTLLAKGILEHHEVPEDIASNVFDGAVAALWHFRRGEGAAWLLPIMLRRHTDLGSRVGVVRKIARRWLNAFATDEPAGNVLAAICAQPDSLGRPAILGEAVLAWLERHGGSVEAAGLLHEALGSAFLPEEVKERVHSAALDWLKGHAAAYTAGNVIIALLGHSSCPEDSIGAVITCGTAWVVQHAHSPKAGFVFESLLQSAALDSERRAVLADSAVQWLACHTEDELALLVIRRLMRIADLPSQQLEKTVHLTLAWVNNHQEHWISGGAFLEIFTRFYRSGDQPIPVELLLELVNAAIEWMRRHSESSLFGTVFAASIWGSVFPIPCAVHVVEPSFKWLLSSREPGDVAAQTIKRFLKYCVENGLDEHRATMRRLCQSIVESLPEQGPGEELLAELGLPSSTR